MIKFAVIVATLMRPSLYTAVDSIRKQYSPNMIIEPMIRYDPGINEYASRHMAISDTDADCIAILDDDAYYEPHTLENVHEYLTSYDFVDGAVRGNIFGRGVEVFDQPHLGIGTAQFFNRDAYFNTKHHGYELEWGTEPDAGWRMDTALLFDFMNVHTGKDYKHASDIIVNHPNPMMSQWNPYIEWLFYREYTEYVERYILPLDGRLPDVIKHADLMDRAVEVLGKSMNDIILKYHKGVIVPTAYAELEMAIRAKEDKENEK